MIRVRRSPMRLLSPILLSLLFAPWTVLAQVPDVILDLLVTAEITEDGKTRITETILYDFGPKELHGIYRNIPLRAQEGNALREFGIKDVAVTGRDGAPVPFETELTSDRTHLRLKIGDPERLVTGVVEYRITYAAESLMRGLPKHDEWVWDATSSNWPVSIRRARANIILPKSIATDDLVRSCATIPAGGAGRAETCQVGFIDDISSGTATSVQMMDLEMSPRETMLLGLAFPKGFIEDVPMAKAPGDQRQPHPIEILSGALMLVLVGAIGKEMVFRHRPDFRRLIRE